MPTARELLEQADALMRRNRLASNASDDGIPILTDPVAEPPPRAAATPPAQPAAVARPPAPAVQDLDDVPLLTDAVEEIEAPSILDAGDEDVGADAWSETLTGSHPTEGRPPAEHVVDLPIAGATVESIDITLPPAEEPALAERTWYDPHELATSAPVPESPSTAESAMPVEALFDVNDGAADVEPPATPAHFVDAGAADIMQAVTLVEPEVSAVPHSEHGEEREVVPDAHIAPREAEQPPVADPAPAARVDDDARWTQLAEEVRMQVLQRIDLFTDTGLREQLAARLQPIVDRASADLVATINQHVGVLLLAYVAEAIEREIERWRDQSR